MTDEIKKLQADGLGDVEIERIYKEKLDKGEIDQAKFDEVLAILHETAQKRDVEQLFRIKL